MELLALAALNELIEKLKKKTWDGDSSTIKPLSHVRFNRDLPLNIGVRRGDVGVVQSVDGDFCTVSFPTFDDFRVPKSNLVIDETNRIRQGSRVTLKNDTSRIGYVYTVSYDGNVSVQFGGAPHLASASAGLWNGTLRQLRLAQAGEGLNSPHGMQCSTAVRMRSPTSVIGDELGYVRAIRSDGEVVADFPSKDNWVGPASALKVDKAADEVRPGVSVRVRRAITQPAYDWGGVTHQSVGSVISCSYDGRVIVVCFDEDSEWWGKLGELIPIHVRETAADGSMNCFGCHGLTPSGRGRNERTCDFCRTVIGAGTASFRCDPCDTDACVPCFLKGKRVCARRGPHAGIGGKPKGYDLNTSCVRVELDNGEAISVDLDDVHIADAFCLGDLCEYNNSLGSWIPAKDGSTRETTLERIRRPMPATARPTPAAPPPPMPTPAAPPPPMPTPAAPPPPMPTPAAPPPPIPMPAAPGPSMPMPAAPAPSMPMPAAAASQAFEEQTARLVREEATCALEEAMELESAPHLEMAIDQAKHARVSAPSLEAARTKLRELQVAESRTSALKTKTLKTEVPLDSDEWFNSCMVKADAISGREFLGRGGFGCVYKVTANIKGERKTVALKELRAGSAAERVALVKDIQREAYAMCKADNEYVTRFYGLCMNEGESPDVHLLMEYLPYNSLREALDRPPADEKFIPIQRSYGHQLSILTTSAKGMAKIHELGILHRDLSSRNILLAFKDGLLIGKISDFGLASGAGMTGRKSTRRTRPSQQTCGTVYYEAPESIERGIYTKASEVYSFGIIIFEVVTGKFPWRDECSRDAHIMHLVLEGRRPMMPDTPAVLKQLAENCWCQEPADRLPFEIIPKFLAMMSPKGEGEYAVYLSYNAETDSELARLLYLALRDADIKVWFSPKTLRPDSGQDTSTQCVDALFQSQLFVPLISNASIANYVTLAADADFDQVLLEQRLAVELADKMKIMPVLVGDVGDGHEYGEFRFPTAISNVVVASIEDALARHFRRTGRTPVPQRRSIRDTLKTIDACGGLSIAGEKSTAIQKAADRIGTAVLSGS